MTIFNQPPSPNQPPTPAPSPAPIPTPAPPPAPAPADPMVAIAAAQTVMASVAVPNSQTFASQVKTLEEIQQTLEQQVAAFTGTLPLDEVWLRVYQSCCEGGRLDLASKQAAEAQAEYAQRFPRVTV